MFLFLSKSIRELAISYKPIIGEYRNRSVLVYGVWEKYNWLIDCLIVRNKSG